MKINDFLLFQIPPLIITIIVSICFIYLHFCEELKTKENSSGKSLEKYTSISSNSRYAFATLVTPAFAMGAVVLGHQLKILHGDQYDRVCLISPDVNETWRTILSQWWIVKPVQEYKPMQHFRRSWTKLRIFEMDEYEKLVYLDTDLLVIKPIDELFKYPQLSCVPDVNPPQICNTGVLVIEPKKGIFEKIDHMARVEMIRLGIGDQSSINAFFGGFHPLPPHFNTPRTQESGLGFLLSLNRSSVIHFVCKKPWKCGREGIRSCGCGYFELNRLWWEKWDEACHGHQCIESWVEFKATKKPKIKNKKS